MKDDTNYIDHMLYTNT